jgi:hypothetical protein
MGNDSQRKITPGVIQGSARAGMSLKEIRDLFMLPNRTPSQPSQTLPCDFHDPEIKRIMGLDFGADGDVTVMIATKGKDGDVTVEVASTDQADKIVELAAEFNVDANEITRSFLVAMQEAPKTKSALESARIFRNVLARRERAKAR